MPEVRISSEAPVAEPEARKDQTLGSSGEVRTPSDPPKKEEAPKKKYAEKFDSVEDLEKSYLELQKQFSGKKQESTPEAKKETPAPEAPKGFDMAELNAEFAENDGKLTDATLKALEKQGISKGTLDTFFAGQKALMAQMQTSLSEAVGGDDTLTSLLEWAKTGLSKGEQALYNAAVDARNTEGAKMLLQGMLAKYTAAVGSDPELIGGGTGGRDSDLAPYKSNMEMIKDMNSRRYAEDPAFRETVKKRLERSTFGN